MLQRCPFGTRIVLYSSDSEDLGSVRKNPVRKASLASVSSGSEMKLFDFKRTEVKATTPKGFLRSGEKAAKVEEALHLKVEETLSAGWSSDAREGDGRKRVKEAKVVSVPSKAMGSSPATSGFFTSPEKGSQRLFLESISPAYSMSPNN